jgi:hypothetical protein
VRNTYNISLLRRRIQESLPRPPAPAGEMAIEGFLSLPGSSAWRPDRLGLRELSFIFDIGLPFALMGDKPVAKTLGLHVGEAVRDGRTPEAGLWSAVHAVALLCHWGIEVNVTSGVVGPQLQFEIVPPGAMPLSLDVRREMQEPTSARVVALDMRSAAVSFETAAAYYGNLFRDDLAAVLLFEPRFWIGIEQKEWLHMARLGENAEGLEPRMFGSADGDRFAGAQSLRLPLLT